MIRITIGLFLTVGSFGFCCTNILVTKGASADGSVFVSHSDDGSLTDQRIVYVPAKDHPPGSQREIASDDVLLGSTTVRYVGTGRGPQYNDPTLPPTKVLGRIDQVPHTYAYFDGNYGIANEHQLMIGEATNGAKFTADPKENERIFYSSELLRVALERCTKAKEAVQLMGSLIDQYGFYGPGETLILADPNEGWVMEICSGTSERSKGLWVAKKVPDGEVFIAANEFRIREVQPDDPDTMYCKNLFQELQESGWWNPKKGPLDWLSAVSYGESNHPYYSLRRVWRITQRLKPSQSFSPWVKDGFTKEYPFSFVPDRKLTLNDVMAMHRDHYEGTEFDLTQGPAAGPFGCPYRYVGPYDSSSENLPAAPHLPGAWERAISVFNVGYITINQARSWLPDAIGGICWFGPDKPYLTCFVPFYVGVLDLPAAYQTANPLQYDPNSAWWTFNFVSNWAATKFSYIKQDVTARQKELEQKEALAVSAMDQQAQSLFAQDPERARALITKFSTDTANKVVREWQNLTQMLLVKYNDGYVNIPELSKSVGYPEEWLKVAKYKKGPVSYSKK